MSAVDAPAPHVTVVPETFTLVPYDRDVIAALAAEVAVAVGMPADVPLHIEVDEELFAPLVGTASDRDEDGRAIRVWVSGANFEAKRRPMTFSPEQARPDLATAILRGCDRLSEAFADAPADAALDRATRAAWDAWAAGRAERRGFDVRRPARQYEFRLQHGFSDVADAAFDRLWAAGDLGWDDLVAITEETGAAQRPPSAVPADVLRRRA